MKIIEHSKIAVIGLGYVGLPLAVEFGKFVPVMGYDLNEKRVQELKNGYDVTLEVEKELLNESRFLNFTCILEEIKECNVFIITVPTPIDKYKRPDLSPLINSSRSVGSLLKKDDLVIYESTVYPGATEEECIPVLEKVSGLKFNVDFFVGYSPERVNPGDKERRVSNVLKVTSGSNEKTADYVDSLYRLIIKAGTHKASSIKVAEASKVIENTQRDLNIALMNELAIIFNKIGIDTNEVLNAAGTKWNFLPFRPGLVGGHCIGVDPYYLTHKAQELGYHPEIILAGRRINDGMGEYVASQIIKLMVSKEFSIKNSNVLILGLTFKENCTDIRNTKIVDMINELESFNVNVEVYDPWVDKEEAKIEYGLSLVEKPKRNNYQAVVLAVAHKDFIEIGEEELKSYGCDNHVFYDIKSVLNKELSDGRL